jgi:hypothetical protein
MVTPTGASAIERRLVEKRFQVLDFPSSPSHVHSMLTDRFTLLTRVCPIAGT